VIIGLLSDSHGDVKRTARAVEILRAHRPDRVFHCGDIGSNAVLTELAAGFADPVVSVTCVLGNVDGWSDEPLAAPLPHVIVHGRFYTTELDGQRIAVMHGDDFRRLRAVIESGTYDLVFTGHTHVAEDTREGRTRIINPGALHRARQPACAVLDLTTGTLTPLPLA
jgi:putative phosphoesterase